jgi:hypothetical protein
MLTLLALIAVCALGLAVLGEIADRTGGIR